MNDILLFAVILFDLVLLFLFMKLKTDNESSSEVLREVLEEKRQITDMVAAYSDELKALSREAKDTYDRINMIAAESALELENAGSIISSQVEKVLEDLSGEISSNFEKISSNKSSLEEYNLSMSKTKKSLSRLVNRAEKLIKFFNDSVPYEQVLEEIEDKKYMDARHLLADGYSPEEVSSELNLSVSEVKLLVSML